MCGVYGCLGSNKATQETLDGLKQLQYRGYDSWGVAFSQNQQLNVYKSLDALDSYDEFPIDNPSIMALGHTRWATHGEVTLKNCHPLVAASKQFCLVHNGIVENLQQLQSAEAHNDTQVILQLLEQQLTDTHCYQPQQLQQALVNVFTRLEGRNTLLVLDHLNQQIIGIKDGSPLVIAEQDNNYVLCSDPEALAPCYRQYAIIPDRSIIILQQRQITVTDLQLQPQKLPWRQCGKPSATSNPSPYKHHMLQEIMQQWQSVTAAVLNVDQLKNWQQLQRPHQRLFFTGAGGALFVAQALAAQCRQQTHRDARAIAAYDYNDHLPLMRAGDLLICVSQSGETADVLDLATKAKQMQLIIVSLINAEHSTLQQLSDLTLPSRSGREICVLSTKTASAQMVGGSCLNFYPKFNGQQLRQAGDELSTVLAQYLHSDVIDTANRLCAHLVGHSVFILGKGESFYSAQITALNIKEASYLHAEAFTMGELKHGVLALVSKQTPVIIFADDVNRKAAINAACEVKARGAFVIAISHHDHPIFDVLLPIPQVNSIFNCALQIIPGQLLAYCLATQQGLNPDKPRNLAKSVTVV